jgi:DNA mismatch repair protein MutS
MSVRDLHFKKEIIPLFDFVCNEYSRDVLSQLFSEIPEDMTEILFRQQILKAIIGHEPLFRPWSYAKSELNEVYIYSANVNRQHEWQGSFPKMRFLFSGSRKIQREKGQLTQLYIFLQKIGQFYFSHLDIGQFPADFADRLRNMTRLLAELEVGKYEEIARRRGLTILELTRLSGLLSQKAADGELDVFWKDFFLFEAFLSIAKGITKHRFTFPQFIDDGLVIKEFYHPLVRGAVKNSIDVRENVTLITGPNMSGKSTLLKAVGLCVALAHLGLAVPAEKCELQFFEVISVAINLNDDIISGYSHFMTEIKNLKKIVVEALDSKKCFAVFDELFRGTNVEDAAVISLKTILGLTRFRHSYFFISTHLHQLKECFTPDDHIGTRYIECSLIDDTPVFTYKLREGWSDLKIGQIIFEQEGLNELLSRTTAATAATAS